ncbi:hypothetical protein LPMP_352680 [Leishmania panamensis]|uniref:Fanconi-associated nuclease n=1 Tax=Leishmania panamensis TaxID=5679 RepID=A0A088S464_LEIPA|nr:hypothetical protein LPMP_352680 [Leishmania panamensis]AIO02405.1 hypothetical protein LPMP_352680 [Leishmania panamensis]
MSADADATPTDPFLKPRRSPKTSRSSAINDSAMLVEVVDAGQTTSSSSVAAAALFAARLRPSVTVATGASTSPRDTLTPLASSAATSRGAAAIMPHTRKRKRPAAESASAGSSTSTTAAPPLAQKRQEAAQRKSEPSRRTGGAARTAMDHGQHSKYSSDEDALGGATVAGGGDDAEGYGSGEDGEGDAEERALVATASSLMAGQGAFATTSAVSATPHPWLVTDAFHVCLWYVLRYAGSALSAEDLWSCRALVSLTAVEATEKAHAGECGLLKGAISGTAGAERMTAAFAAERAPGTSMQSDGWDWTGSEESELLLRLLLRKSHSFTARHLELRYGDWLHVQSALNALTQRRFLWWATKGASLDSAADGVGTVPLHGAEEEAATDLTETPLTPDDELTEMAPSQLVKHYDGARVARLLLNSCDEGRTQCSHAAAIGESMPTFGSMEAVIRVAQAVRVTEFRTFLTMLRHRSKARAAMDESAQEGDECITTSSIISTSASTLGISENIVCKDGGAGRDVVAEQASVLRLKSCGRAADIACARPRQMSDNSLYDVIPGRKRDMIRYLVERRYSVWAPSSTVKGSPEVSATPNTVAMDTTVPSYDAPCTAPHALCSAPLIASPALRGAVRCTSASVGATSRPLFRRCFRTVAEEADAVAQCWDRVIGSVYVPHSGLKQHLTWMTELFHVLSSNHGAGMMSEKGAKSVVATMTVATPPTLLMTRPQLLLLLQTLRAARRQERPSLPESSLSTAAHLNSNVFAESVPYALLPRWFSPPPVAKATRAVPRPCRQLDRGIPSNGGAGNTMESQPCPDVSVEPNDDESNAMDDIVYTTHLFRAFGAAGDDVAAQTFATPPRVRLFASPAILQEYRRALSIQRKLYYATDGATTAAQRHRGKSRTFVSCMYDTVMAAVHAGVAAVKQHPLHARSASSASFVSGEMRHFVSMYPPALPVVSDTAPSPKLSTPSVTVSLESLVYQQGCYAEHLLTFTPLYRWFACLELLFPLLQSGQRYSDANACLHHLLYEPIFVLHHLPVSGSRSPISPVTYAFCFKPHKRGKWLARMAQNLSHQKRYAEALAVLEECQAGYHELASHAMGDARLAPAAAAVGNGVYVASAKWLPCDVMTNSTAAALCDVLMGNRSPTSESALPLKVQRRGRMLRVLWGAAAAASVLPAANNSTTSLPQAEKPSPVSLALLHAAWEYVRDRYCRRQDRLTLERLLAVVHRKVHQWTSLAAHRDLATRSLVDVAVRHVGGVRDALNRILWREPSVQAHGLTTTSTGGVVRAAKSMTPSEVRNPQHHPALPVELFVLQHYLNRWNGASSTTATAAGLATVPQHRRRNDTMATDPPKGETERSDGIGDVKVASMWCGEHCEGQWIACFARAFLWDCYWSFPPVFFPLDGFPVNACDHKSNRPPLQTCPTHGVLWLSAFQDGPLDLATPIQFLWRRRALVEARLAKLERCTREELVDFVAARIKVAGNTEGARPSKARARGRDTEVEAPRAEDDVVQRADEDEGYSGDEERERHRHSRDEGGRSPRRPRYTARVEERCCVSNDENSVRIASSFSATPLLFTEFTTPSLLLGQVGREASAEMERVGLMRESGDASLSSCSSTLAIPEAWKVPVGSLPLLDILRAIPLEPLWRLLRCLYLSPVTEGVPLEFSGFPDLVFWRTGGCGGGNYRYAAIQPSAEESSTVLRASFCLMEVKSPNDCLSTKQIAVNDLLRRCGFEVFVVHVDEVHDDGRRVSTKCIR